jgi:hypothetical protein
MKKQLGRKKAVAAEVTLVTGSFTSAQKVKESELQFREALHKSRSRMISTGRSALTELRC